MTSSTMTRLLPRPYRPLLAHAGFRRLLPALAASDLGDGMSAVAVAWLAIVISPPGRSAWVVGAALAAYALPGAAGALLFGRRLRRLPPARLMVVDGRLRALLLGAVPLAWALGVLHPALYVALLAGSSVLHAWGSAGRYSLIAQLLPTEQRLAANALVATSASASIVVGPALAGLLTVVIGPAWIIGLDALSFALLAVQAGRIRVVAEVDGAEADGTAVAGGSVPGLLRRQPELLGVLALTWFFNLLYGPVEVALPLHVVDDLGSGAGLLGLYWSVFGAGAVLGALAAGALRGLPRWLVTLGIVAGWGLVLVPFGLDVPVGVSLACMGVGGVIYGPFTALSFTLFQDRTPTAWLTTVLAFRGAALLTAGPVGTALGGPLTAVMGPRLVLAASGLATVALAAVAAALLWCAANRRRTANRRPRSGGSGVVGA
ncbi:MFS transporter [Streptomyces sp. NPDC059917]|uniref:MFS transporter n=1 Tax=Streptomyces sp. NPDC059917 TaxID=3347002 RepID=UPI0036653F98